MRAVVQRVTRASVEIGGREHASIGPGLAVLAGVARGDEDADVTYLADKVANLRVLADDAGRMNRSVLDTGGEVLLVSQFTLIADTRKGRRPSFVGAEAPEQCVQADRRPGRCPGGSGRPGSQRRIPGRDGGGAGERRTSDDHHRQPRPTHAAPAGVGLIDVRLSGPVELAPACGSCTGPTGCGRRCWRGRPNW